MPSSFIIKTFIIFTSFFFFINATQAQLRKIQGVVKDSVTGETLENATIAVYRLPDSVLVVQTRSTKSGYTFRRGAGNYLLITSFVGYNNDSIAFSLLPGDDVMNMRPVTLVKSGTHLTEVVVRSVVPPVIVKNDTIIFNTGSFNLRPHSSVEELLRKLPGVEVDRDGNVTVQGRRVEKIFIDGKEFLLNDPKLATQNLLADMVEKIEAFDNKSELAKRTGITDMNAGKAINLRLKPG
ncbi:MAG TPA: hypothetical protein VHM26_16510, partial [Chitinophagaceae bacterium]|nr:hypothetical protein [Chitinophagaceae bacterium]